MERSIIEVARQDLSEWLGWPPDGVTEAILSGSQDLMPEGTLMRMEKGVRIEGAFATFAFACRDGYIIAVCIDNITQDSLSDFVFSESPSPIERPGESDKLVIGTRKDLRRWMSRLIHELERRTPLRRP
jgi:hypothetical protein